MRKILVKPIVPSSVQSSTYDIIVATCGFEERARRTIEQYDLACNVTWAPSFSDRQQLAFAENAAFYQQRGFDTASVSDAEFGRKFRRQIDVSLKNRHANSTLKILVDVSSMSRLRMASIIDVARCAADPIKICVDFIYCVAEYTTPPDFNLPIVECGSVSPQFAGFSADPSQSTVAVFGAGYEQDQLIGVLDLLEAEAVWVFLPVGPDERYLESVNLANLTLWEEVPKSRRLPYRVLQPYETFIQVESLLHGLLAERRPIVVPFGPKIFTVISLLACATLHPRVPLWRVSTGQIEPPVNRQGSSHFAAIAAEFLD